MSRRGTHIKSAAMPLLIGIHRNPQAQVCRIRVIDDPEAEPA